MELYNEDCLEGMKRLADNSVDLILTDLPYNLTACKWDLTPIDLAKFWEQCNRILKPCCSAVLFASSRFTYKLVASNVERFKYKWIWVKNAPTMFIHAKNAPMRKFEEILVFSDGSINHASCTNHRMKYNPQGVVPCMSVRPVDDGLKADGTVKHSQVRGKGLVSKNTNRAESIIGDRPSRAAGTTYVQEQTGYPSDVIELPASKFIHSTHKESSVNIQGGKLRGNRHGKFGSIVAQRPSHPDFYIQEQTGYPTDVLHYNAPASATKIHPSQKPVDLLEFLIKTYTDEGEVVLDATMGSGSTGVAAVNTGRDFIGFELDEKFFNIAKERIEQAIAPKVQSLF